MGALLVPPFKLSGSDSIIPRSTSITKIFGNTGGFSLSVGGTSASTAQLDVLSDVYTRKGLIVKGGSGAPLPNNQEDLISCQEAGGNTVFTVDDIGQITVLQNATPVGGFSQVDLKMISSSSTVTINGSTSEQNSIYFANTWNMAGTATLMVGLGFSSTFKNDPASLFTSASSIRLFQGTPTVIGDTQTTGTEFTVGNIDSLFDGPICSTDNSGNLTVTRMSSITSRPSINTGVTVTTRNAIRIRDAIGSGTLTNQYGVLIESLTKGSTNISLYVQGTAHSRHIPSMSIGADSTPTAQLDVVSASSTTIGHIIKGAASQSANLLEVQDSSSNKLVSVDFKGFLRVYDSALTLSGLTGDNLVFVPANTITRSLTGSTSIFRASCTLNMTATQTVASSSLLFSNNMTIKNDPALTGALCGTSGRLVSFNQAMIVQADTNATTCQEVECVRDATTFNRINSGTLTVTEFNSFLSSPANNTGVTIIDRRALYVNDITGGTITTNTGIEINDLTGGSTNISLRIKGTTGHSRHQPKMMVGADSAPTSQLQMGAGFFEEFPFALTYASPTSVDPTKGNVFTVTTVNATGSVTFNFSATPRVGTYKFIITNDATSGKTITFGTNFRPNGTLIGTISKVAVVTFVSDGTNAYEVSRTTGL